MLKSFDSFKNSWVIFIRARRNNCASIRKNRADDRSTCYLDEAAGRDPLYNFAQNLIFTSK